MKKTILFFLLLAIIFSVSACTKRTLPETASSETEEMEFSEIQWPKTDIAKLIPVPKSTIGNIKWSESYGFVIYVAETPIEDYAAYVSECEKRGFTLKSRKGEDFFFGHNSDGYHVHITYEGNDVMFVRIDDPEDESSEETVEPTIEPTGEPTTSPTSKPVHTPEPKHNEPPAESATPEPETPTPTATPKPTEGPTSSSEDYSDSSHQSIARRSFENYGDYICPYGIKYHWFDTHMSDYEGNGVWYFKVGVTITNQFNATRDAVAEGRVSFIEEAVTEFELLDDWE